MNEEIKKALSNLEGLVNAAVKSGLFQDAGSVVQISRDLETIKAAAEPK